MFTDMPVTVVLRKRTNRRTRSNSSNIMPYTDRLAAKAKLSASLAEGKPSGRRRAIGTSNLSRRLAFPL
jgi:hypothetical protein